ncbi:right-handed parallel beta-helix repeat-containing protein [bacterium]|nr:right-handed parallel beta-helix repeat-containing protein [bacterium]MBU1675381.1 right-handed parallel beta-helix repeat-containing protein [bacterium]
MRTIISIGLMVFLLPVFTASALLATTIVVDHAGSGDYTTIGEAVTAAPSGAEIVIMPGTYPEFVIVAKSLTFTANGLPGSVIWDGENSHRILKVRTPIAVSFTGIEFRDGFDPIEDGCGVAIHIDTGAVVTIDQCRFINNHASWDGAVFAGLSGTSVTITNSHFEDNYAYHNCPAAGVLLDAEMVIDNCTFIDNICSNISGAVASWQADLSVQHCLFAGNTGGTAGAILVSGGGGDIYNNTFHDNHGGNVVLISTSSPYSYHHNIMTINTSGGGLYMSSGITHGCNLFYEIAGDEVSGGLAPDEIVADPLYCDYTVGDFNLCYMSPALPENNGCGMMGAFSMGCTTCGPIANEDRAWGDVKKMYD